MSSEPVTTAGDAHRPAPGKVIPVSTYRLQLHCGFTFDDAAAQADYVSALGVSHVYLSPILQAVPGSTHGYDVVDHSRISDDLGGGRGLARLREQLGAENVGAVADVVPNHMAVPTPALLNECLWSVLRDGPLSPFAEWFDVDWSVEYHALLMPVLAHRIGDVLEAGDIRIETSGDEALVRYFDHVFPVRPGTEHLPLPSLLDRQWYRLAHWRVGDEELNYRRFFDVDTLAGIKVERDDVFAETHAVLLALVAEGGLDGLRIDHPDGLADPRRYLRMLSDSTDRCWTVVEKILEGSEQLPVDWKCAGTTGYDALRMIGGIFVDPSGADALTKAYSRFAGAGTGFDEVAEAAKRDVLNTSLQAEVTRLVELASHISSGHIVLRDHTRRGLHEAITNVLVAMPVYRAYVVPGEDAPPLSAAILEQAAARARGQVREEWQGTVLFVRDLALGRLGGGPLRDEFVIRFQQTCGPVMAKGVEDTAFYRWWRLSSLNEVGGDPAQCGIPLDDFHAWCASMQRDWPVTMTTLSTHDTKRSEDVRARLAVLSECPGEWEEAVAGWRSAAHRHGRGAEWPDAETEYLLWQTIFGAWPISPERLVAYLEKATREAKLLTSWVEPNAPYDRSVAEFATRVLADRVITRQVADFVQRTWQGFRANVLGQKLVQLTAPGVPDNYQGCEIVNLSLVDPDNRRPVDYGDLRRRLAALDKGIEPATLDDEKLLVTSRTLQLRRSHPEWFGADGSYAPLPVSSPHAVAFVRSESAASIATRLSMSLIRSRGWRDESVILPDGEWEDVFSGTRHAGEVPLAALLARLPVALLARLS